MSFILDALRKSENERQREAPPSLARVPFATSRRETPIWIWFVIGALSLAIVAIAIGWWRTNQVEIDSPPQVAATESIAVPADTSARNPAAANFAATPAAGNPSPASAEPRSISELATMDRSLPSYELQFIEYNAARPDTGSAWINGSLYRPGDRLDTGPELVEVHSDSVVLGYGGSTFLLELR